MRILASLILALLLLACGNDDGSPSSGDGGITLNVSGAAPGTVVLVGQYMEQQFQADTATADASGTVHFARDTTYDPGYYFAFFNDQTTLPLLLDEDQTFTLTTSSIDVIGSARVEGSEETRLLYTSLQAEPGIDASMSGPVRETALQNRSAYYDSLFLEYPNTFFTSYMKAALPPLMPNLRRADGSPDKAAQIDAYRAEYWTDVDFSDERLLRTPAITNRLNLYYQLLVDERSDSVIAATEDLLGRLQDYPVYQRAVAQAITLRYRPGKTDLMDPEAVFVHMVRNHFTRESAAYMDSMQVYALQDQASMMDKSLLGQRGPDITVADIDGNPRRLFDSKAPYLLVYIYNPDCDHCMEETPKLLEWYRRNRGRAEVYAVALGTEPERWKSFVEEYGIQDWTNVHDPTDQAVYQTYYVDSTPELYVLDRDRRIIAKNIDTEALAELIGN